MKTSRGRAAVQLCALLSSTVLSSQAAAQSVPPTYRNLDANGVDLTRGDYLMSLTEGSIGSGRNQLSLVRESGYISGYNGHYWDSLALYETSSTRSVAFGQQRSEYFTGTSSAQGNGATLTLSGTSYVHRSADGTVTTFEKQDPNCTTGSSDFCIWRPTSSVTPDGREATFTWDQYLICPDQPLDPEHPCTVDSVRLASVSNSAGYSIVFTYAADGTGGTSAPSPSWSQRTQADFYNGWPAGSPSGTVTYSYPSTNVTQITDMAGQSWRVTGGALVSGIRRPGASSDTTTINRSGYVTSVVNEGITTNYAYSVSGSTATMVVTDAASNATTIVSDLTVGRPTSVTNALSQTTSFQYDSYGRMTRVTQPLGNYVEQTFDARGNVTQTQAVPVSGSGLATITTSASFDSTCSNPVTCNSPNTTTDALGNVTDYTYDSTHGSVASVTLPAPSSGAPRPQTRYTYALTGGEYRLSEVSACATGTVASSCVGTTDETRRVYTYGSNDTVASVETRNGVASNVSGYLSATTAYTYTPLGDVETVDGPLSGTADTTRYRYAAGRRLVGVIGPDPDGGGSLRHRATRLVYHANGQVSQVLVGNVASQSDTDWAAFSWQLVNATVFDANARPIARVAGSSGNLLHAVSEISYDALGRVDCVAQRMNPPSSVLSLTLTAACSTTTAGSFGEDRITRTTYDALGRPTQAQSGYAVSGQTRTVASTTYTANGQLATVTDGESNRTSYTYDGHGRLSRTSYPVGTQGAATSSTTDYEELTYDAAGHVTSRRLRDNSNIGYSYDNLGRLAGRNLPGSEPDVTYGYDNFGRMISAASSVQTLSFGFDALGRNTSQGTNTFGTMQYQYDVAGRRTRMSWPDGLDIDYDYDVAGAMLAIREEGATTGIGVLATFAYDDLGRRTSLTRGNGTVTSYSYGTNGGLSSLAQDMAGTSDDLTLGFSRNPAGQIVGNTRSNDAYSWEGHRNTNRAYVANGLNQYSTSGPATLTYGDGRGNLTGVSNPGFPAETYGYNSENMLTSATGGVSLSYDPLLRLYETSGSATVRFAYDGLTMATEYDTASTPNILRRYVHGPSPDEPVVWYEGSSTSDRRFLHADERGSVVAVSNSSGSVTNTYTYDEHGIPGSSYASRFQYTGQSWLPDVGMSYYRARIYSPTLGRFMQSDPIGFRGGVNFYAYVGSDPINYSDPSGLCRSGEHRVYMFSGLPASDDGETITVNIASMCVGYTASLGVNLDTGEMSPIGPSQGDSFDAPWCSSGRGILIGSTVECTIPPDPPRRPSRPDCSGSVTSSGLALSGVLGIGPQVTIGRVTVDGSGEGGWFASLGAGSGLDVGASLVNSNFNSVSDFRGYGEASNYWLSYSPVSAAPGFTGGQGWNRNALGNVVGSTTSYSPLPGLPGIAGRRGASGSASETHILSGNCR